MSFLRSLTPLLFLCSMIACDKPMPTLDDIDTDRWSMDKNACGGVRASTLSSLEAQMDKLLSLDQMQIVNLLGKPDQNELSRRNEKFFYYFIDPAPVCAGAAVSPRRLEVRFNAVGLAKEVMIIDGE